MEGPLWSAHFFSIHYQSWPPHAVLFSDWPINGFRGEEFLKSANQKQESPMATMFVNGSGRNEHYLQRIFHRCFLPSFGSFGQAVPLLRMLISSQSINKLGCHRQFLFLIDWFLKNLLLWNRFAKWTKTFLPSLISFGQAVLEIDHSETRIAYGGHVC
jgi:hypothetical protein